MRRNPLHTAWRAAGYVLGGGLLAFLVIPVVALFVTGSPTDWLAGIRHPITAPAMLLSLTTTALSLGVLVVFGTPLAWWLGRSEARIARLIETAIQLPIVVPPAVAGLALLLAFGRRGLLGSLLQGAGIDIAFSTIAVVLAQVFVAAPFYIQAATTAFAGIDENLLVVARTLGARPASVLFRIALPLARRGLIAGAALAWARALGEFGATLMFAGNLQGKTQTLPLAVYTALESDVRAAQALAVILVVIALLIIVFLRPRRGRQRR
ncbi:MAG TPA: ABC transporter permease [Kofleriaceae bacterium]|nr:ABC transporter permease [Kofleriaceae bacterium]